MLREEAKPEFDKRSTNLSFFPVPSLSYTQKQQRLTGTHTQKKQNIDGVIFRTAKQKFCLFFLSLTQQR